MLADALNAYVVGDQTIEKDSITTVARLVKLPLPDEFVVLTHDMKACDPSTDLKDAFETLKDGIPHLANVGEEA